MVQGEDGTPVIVSPAKPPIAWSLYEAVAVRMPAAAGREIKIKIGDREFRRALGPAGKYHLYRFDIQVDAPAGSRRSPSCRPTAPRRWWPSAPSS